jgi:hypothetical protein
VREVVELGYPDLPLSTLVQMRIHDVSPRFIRDLQGRGYADLSAERLVSMRIHGWRG